MKKRLILLFTSLFLVLSSFTVDTDKYFEIAKNLEIFTSIYKELNTHYVDDLDPNTVMRTGIDAIMNSLDPYTVYYSESQVESYRINLDDRYNGLGAASKSVDDRVTIVEVYQDGPCYEAGVQVGDQIRSVNGQSAQGKSYDDVMTFLRGYPGTSVQLGLYRPGTEETFSVDLTRSEVDIPNVPYSGMVDDQIGYIALTTFTRDAGKNIASALRKLRSNNDVQGLILDLRGNGGGLLSEAIDILGIFLPKDSPVVTTKGKVKDRDQAYSTRRTPIDTDLPIVVLINKNSASASEIVSGAIQDYDRGVILGQRSYGKGLVQNQREVGYNSRIKITTSKYYIPSGRCIQSVEYENGEPKDIADSDREVFRTKNGRPVLDGGGVTPDIKLEVETVPDVLQALQDQNLIFKYVNAIELSDLTEENMEAFSFTDYSGFERFLGDKGFSFLTKEEEALETFLKASSDLDFEEEKASITKKVAAEKSDDLSEYKGDIMSAIELEIAKRAFYQKGKAFIRLRNDKEVDAAISLLKDSNRYQETLQ